MRVWIILILGIVLGGCVSTPSPNIAPGRVLVLPVTAYATRANVEGHEQSVPGWEQLIADNLTLSAVKALGDNPGLEAQAPEAPYATQALSDAATHWLYETYVTPEAQGDNEASEQPIDMKRANEDKSAPEYGLQLYARSVYADALNQVAQVLVGALLLSPGRPYGGDKFLTAALFSMQTGEVLWHGQVQIGDARQRKQADAAAKTLLMPLLKSVGPANINQR